MSSQTMRLPGSVAEIAGSPEGPEVAACFDLDGTLIAGYSVKYLGQERMRQREVSLSELVRTIGVTVGVGVGNGSPEADPAVRQAASEAGWSREARP